MRRARILLVDDNKGNRKLLAAVLEADGYRVEEAESGREAVEGVRLLSYDLVLMDVQMPDMDGVEATAAIRSLGGRRADVPIVAISGDIGDDLAARCRAAGMNDHLGKPINPETLQRVVAHWTRPAGEGGQARPAAPGGGPGRGETPLGGLAAHLSGAALLPVIDEFSEGATARMAEIERDASAGDLERVRRIAHDLSGSAANLGLTGLSRLARSIEVASSESDVVTVRRLVAAVPDLLRQVLADLARTRAVAAAGEGPSRSAAAGDDIHPGGP